MPIHKFFKTKRKLKNDSTAGANHPDNSGILSKPFPPLASRAKSPSDLLDMVGYPRLYNVSSPNLAQQQEEENTKRPPVGPRRVSFHASPPPPPPPLLMPKPKMAVPPTRRMLLRSGWADKTLVEGEEDPPKTPKLRDAPSELEALHQQLLMYQEEQQAWAKRDDEHRKREEWMRKKLEETQAQLKQLRQYQQWHSEVYFSGNDDDEAYCDQDDNDDGEKACCDEAGDDNVYKQKSYRYSYYCPRPCRYSHHHYLPHRRRSYEEEEVESWHSDPSDEEEAEDYEWPVYHPRAVPWRYDPAMAAAAMMYYHHNYLRQAAMIAPSMHQRRRRRTLSDASMRSAPMQRRSSRGGLRQRSLPPEAMLHGPSSSWLPTR